eukprot:TRINITY_DN11113_c0_g1_i8.p1 TRINITY_DN11113_c0_g1~~TRINITY_DN11113_c0_g1_i8.p1  ORF type:complete len:1809 (+),score=92.58 TRINITY_DN11113_c0_g1_i8:127-5553(+)
MLVLLAGITGVLVTTQASLENCRYPTNEFSYKGVERHKPCHQPMGMIPIGGKWLFFCKQLDGMLCDGHGETAVPSRMVNCTYAGILGCLPSGWPRWVVHTSDLTELLVSCVATGGNDGLYRCDWDKTAGVASNCAMHPQIQCPNTGLYGLILTTAGTLVMGCGTGLYVCQLAGGTTLGAGGCTLLSNDPCASVSSGMRSIVLDSQGRLWAACANRQSVSCDFTISQGSSHCVRVPGTSPCGTWHMGFHPLPTGHSAVHCIYDGVYTCGRAYPTLSPTGAPTTAPTAPTAAPTTAPTFAPSWSPSGAPSRGPSTSPSQAPSSTPTASPSPAPSKSPTSIPTGRPSSAPTTAPSAPPTTYPSPYPSSSPTTAEPSIAPTLSPSARPSESPSTSPTKAPTASPSVSPTRGPSVSPTATPSASPTVAPSASPTLTPSTPPTLSPTESPTAPSAAPTTAPTTALPSASPSTQPPSRAPTAPPVPPTSSPSMSPSQAPTMSPSRVPSTSSPTRGPSVSPSSPPTESPTVAPSTLPPTMSPSIAPTQSPSPQPSSSPSSSPSAPPTLSPSSAPSTSPTTQSPSAAPTGSPSPQPSASPSTPPTRSPTQQPTAGPTTAPTMSPIAPTRHPSTSPSWSPTGSPSPSPTAPPSVSPTPLPSLPPTLSPSGSPSVPPSRAPSGSPTLSPVDTAYANPTWQRITARGLRTNQVGLVIATIRLSAVRSTGTGRHAAPLARSSANFAATSELNVSVVGPVINTGDAAVILHSDAGPDLETWGSLRQGLPAAVEDGRVFVKVATSDDRQELSLTARSNTEGYRLLIPYKETFRLEFTAAAFEDSRSYAAFCQGGTPTCAPVEIGTLRGERPFQVPQATQDVMDQSEQALFGTAAMGAVLATALGGGAPSPTGNVARQGLIQGVLTCPAEEPDTPEPMERSLSPLQLGFGAPDDTERFARGAVAGAFMIMCALGVIVVFGLGRAEHDFRARCTTEATLGRARPTRSLRAYLILARVPNLVLPHALLYPGVATAAVSIFANDKSGGYIMLGVVGIVCFVVLAIGYVVYAVRKVPRFAAFDSDTGATHCGWLFWGSRGWRPLTELKLKTINVHEKNALHAMVFDGYRGGWRRYTLLFELCYTVIMAIVAAGSPDGLTGCQAQAIALGVIPMLWALYVGALRPYIAPYENVLDCVIALTESLMVAIAYLGMLSEPDTWHDQAAGVVGLVATYAIGLKTILDQCVFIHGQYTLFVSHVGPEASVWMFTKWFLFSQGHLTQYCPTQCFFCINAVRLREDQKSLAERARKKLDSLLAQEAAAEARAIHGGSAEVVTPVGKGAQQDAQREEEERPLVHMDELNARLQKLRQQPLPELSQLLEPDFAASWGLGRPLPIGAGRGRARSSPASATDEDGSSGSGEEAGTTPAAGLMEERRRAGTVATTMPNSGDAGMRSPALGRGMGAAHGAHGVHGRTSPTMATPNSGGGLIDLVDITPFHSGGSGSSQCLNLSTPDLIASPRPRGPALAITRGNTFSFSTAAAAPRIPRRTNGAVLSASLSGTSAPSRRAAGRGLAASFGPGSPIGVSRRSGRPRQLDLSVVSSPLMPAKEHFGHRGRAATGVLGTPHGSPLPRGATGMPAPRQVGARRKARAAGEGPHGSPQADSYFELPAPQETAEAARGATFTRRLRRPPRSPDAVLGASPLSPVEASAPLRSSTGLSASGGSSSQSTPLVPRAGSGTASAVRLRPSALARTPQRQHSAALSGAADARPQPRTPDVRPPRARGNAPPSKRSNPHAPRQAGAGPEPIPPRQLGKGGSARPSESPGPHAPQ